MSAATLTSIYAMFMNFVQHRVLGHIILFYYPVRYQYDLNTRLISNIYTYCIVQGNTHSYIYHVNSIRKYLVAHNYRYYCIQQYRNIISYHIFCTRRHQHRLLSTLIFTSIFCLFFFCCVLSFLAVDTHTHVYSTCTYLLCTTQHIQVLELCTLPFLIYIFLILYQTSFVNYITSLHYTIRFILYYFLFIYLFIYPS